MTRNRTIPRRRIGLATALAGAACAAALATSAAGAAEPTHCQGKITGTVDYQELVVPEGSGCTIEPGAHVTVSGDVRVQAGGTLGILRGEHDRGDLSVGRSMSFAKDAGLVDAGTLTVKGNVTATDARNLYLYDQTTIDGNVELGPWAGDVELVGVSIDGALSIHHFKPTGDRGYGTLVINDSRMGELVLRDNKDLKSLDISGNRIERRLDCVADRGEVLFRFERNTVAGKAVGESACPAS